MHRFILLAVAAPLLTSTASAQHNAAGTLRKASSVKNAGIYHVATGSWTRNASNTANLGPDVIYTNSTNGTYFTTLDLENATGNVQLVDEGRIPTFGGSIPTADRTCYQVNGLTFAYCTEVSTPTIELNFTFFESYLPCDLPSTGAPTTLASGTVAGTGLPGGGAAGAASCWLLTFDLTGAGNFQFDGDGGAINPGFDNNIGQDAFGVSIEFTDQFGSVTGPMLAGDPDWTAFVPGSIDGIGGTGTYYAAGIPSCANTGLDTQDFVAVDGATQLPAGPACYFFGGYKNTNGCTANPEIPYSSFDITLMAATDGCGFPPGFPVFCDPASPNSSGNPAVIQAMVNGPLGATQSGIHLDVSDGPETFGAAFGFFLVSGSATANIILGDGLLCLDAPIGRYNPAAGVLLNSLGVFNGNGDFQNLSGTSTTGLGFDIPTALPGTLGGSIATGSTWHFQLWFRDIGSVSPTVNLSSGVSITF